MIFIKIIKFILAVIKKFLELRKKAKRLVIYFEIKGKIEMDANITAVQTVPATVVAIDGSGNPSPATLTNVLYTSGNTAVFTVAPDNTNPLGATVTGVAAGTGTLTVSATATETDGSTNSVTGTAQVTVTAGAVGRAVSLQVNFGTPTP